MGIDAFPRTAAAVDDVRDRIGASLRHMLGGEPEPRRLHPADDGMFGPDSAVWAVHGDPSILVGAIRSLLMQTLHPPTMAGVADHSAFRADPLGRLQRTGRFLGVVTYGSAAEVDQAITRVRRIHERVEGIAPDGTRYRANDPRLLGWVHAAEVDSFLACRRRYGADPFTARDADRYVAEMAEVARRLGVESPPTSVSELDVTLRSYVPELGVNHQTREALRFLLVPPMPLVARAPYSVLLAGASSTLPGWARRLLLLPPLPVTERLAVRPAAHALTRFLGWALEPREASGAA